MAILIIDDSKMVRIWATNQLEGAGFDVISLDPKSLYQVLKTIHEQRPELVITDYEMPGCNGETLLRAVREDPDIKATPILVFSSHRDADVVKRLSSLELSGYLIKPATADVFLSTVQDEFRKLGLPLPGR